MMWFCCDNTDVMISRKIFFLVSKTQTDWKISKKNKQKTFVMVVVVVGEWMRWYYHHCLMVNFEGYDDDDDTLMMVALWMICYCFRVFQMLTGSIRNEKNERLVIREWLPPPYFSMPLFSFFLKKRIQEKKQRLFISFQRIGFNFRFCKSTSIITEKKAF